MLEIRAVMGILYHILLHFFCGKVDHSATVPYWDCCRIAFLSLFVQNNPYFCVAKTTILPFGNSPVLDRFRYFDKQRTKKEKVLIRAYITRYAAYSVSQLTRLVKEKKETRTLKYGKGKKKHQFKKIYTPEDARLLVLADNAYRRMSGDAMRAVFRDEYALYGKNEYERLSKISH